MRQARKLGLLGLLVCLLAAVGLTAVTGSALAQATKTCTGSGPGGVAVPGGTDTCVVTDTTAIPAGGSLQVLVVTPAGSTGFICTGTSGFNGVALVSGCQFNNNTAATIGPAVPAGSESFVIPAGATGTVTQTSNACSNQILSCVGGTTIATGAAATTGPGAIIAAPAVAKACQGATGAAFTPTGAAPMVGGQVTCDVSAASNPVPFGGSVLLIAPTGTTVNQCISAIGGVTASAISGTACLFVNTTAAPIVPSTALGTENFTLGPTITAGTTLAQTAGTCTNVPTSPTFGAAPPACVIVPGSTAVSGGIIPTGFPIVGGAPVAANASKACNVGSVAPVPGSLDSCTVTTLVPLTANQSLQVTLNVPAATAGLTCTATGSITATAGATAPFTCIFAATSSVAAGTAVGTETFTIPAGTLGGTAISQTATACTTIAFPCTTPIPGITPALPVTVTGPGAVVATQGPGSAQPTGELKTCTNTIATGTTPPTTPLSTAQPTVALGPATAFTIPLLTNSPTICQVNLLRGGTSFPANACNTAAGTGAGALAANTCTDGNVIVTLSTPGAPAIISCVPGTSLGTSGVYPTVFPSTTAGPGIVTVSGGAAACQSQAAGTQLNIPCGTTAGTAAAATTVSTTCTGVLFSVQSVFATCINAATSPACVSPTVAGSNLPGASANAVATVTITFAATPGNGGTTGGVTLGQNTFAFQGTGLGALLVSASPQLIPSNGTLASTVTATFACTSGAQLVNGLVLSNNTPTTTSLLGANTLVVPASSNVCGASLPGTFNFTTQGPLLFDNGRSQETIACGLNSNVNPYGTGVSLTPIGATTPLVFTCSGAAVLAIGAGAAADAPVNVVYQSTVGGLQAIGSTLITVSPAGAPRVSLSCSPGTISAGSTGSLCTATVTDLNGDPLTGSQGSTVTFTTSDPSNTTVLPCVFGTPGSINVTTSPQVIPSLTPNTPCAAPSISIPGQANTFVNGQATALLVASSTAHPETVTVTASLGVLVPPSFACLVSPYLPSNFGSAPTSAGYYAPTSGVGLPGVTGCGTASPIGTTGLATALNGAGVGLTGIVTLPNTSSASTTVNIGGPPGIQVAGATPLSPLVLSRGCNSVIVTSAIGTPIMSLAALVSPVSAVISIWRFDNGTKLFRAGFFGDPNAPTDFSTTGSSTSSYAPNGSSTALGLGPTLTETYYVCVNQGATMS